MTTPRPSASRSSRSICPRTRARPAASSSSRSKSSSAPTTVVRPRPDARRSRPSDAPGAPRPLARRIPGRLPIDLRPVQVEPLLQLGKAGDTGIDDVAGELMDQRAEALRGACRALATPARRTRNQRSGQVLDRLDLARRKRHGAALRQQRQLALGPGRQPPPAFRIGRRDVGSELGQLGRRRLAQRRRSLRITGDTSQFGDQRRTATAPAAPISV